MNLDILLTSPATTWVAGAAFVYGRYALLAGLAFWWCYRRGGRITLTKIQSAPPRKARIWEELRESAVTALVFATFGLGLKWLTDAGHTAIYSDVFQHPWWYLICSFLLLVIIHDTYFYFLHRWFHASSWWRKIHAVHHRSHNPTPFAALAFHPLEAVLEVAIIPLVVLWLPVHPIVLLAFASFSLFWNIYGHLGYELIPFWVFRSRIGRYLNSSTHHNLHHADGRHNFGLYFNYWDRWLGTNSESYLKKVSS
ncbi:sterol desaturase [Lewinellaceae bacterium SD302]|nr:sterol desaturase [Lewinellaceae bacterium SD302]